jgi:hypothetical protein
MLVSASPIRLAALSLAAAFGVLSAGCVAPTDTTTETRPAQETGAQENVAQTHEALQATSPRLDALGSPAIEDLEALYASGTTEGGLPEGRAQGRAFFLGLPGFQQLEDELARSGMVVPSRAAEDFIANAIWHGKTFHRVDADPNDPYAGRIGTLTNQVLGLDLATADIFAIGASSDSDEANTFYLDYSHSDFAVVRGVQDYIRKIGPGLYVGKAFLKLPGAEHRALACFFALDFGQ